MSSNQNETAAVVPTEGRGSATPLPRRAFLTAAASAAAATALGRDYGPGTQPVRYPDPDIVVLDDRFKKYKLGNSAIQRLYHNPQMLWAEGPAWNGVGRYLLWSDIPNNVQMRWLEENGQVSIFRHPSGNSNGNTFDFQGRQISCEHGTRKVVRYEYDGTKTVLAEEFEGKGFNAPNDAVVHPDDGAIFFTDPGYGSLMNYEGHKAPNDSPQPYRKEAVYRIDVRTGEITKLTDEIYKPNGLCFSPDYKKLYVADTGASHYDDAPRNIKVWDVVDGTSLANGREFASMETDYVTSDGEEKSGGGFADGIRADIDGNVWASAGWGRRRLRRCPHIRPRRRSHRSDPPPGICSNVCFGGTKRNRLFMTGSQSLYAVYVETKGAHIT